MTKRFIEDILKDFSFFITHEARTETGLLKFQKRRDECRKILWETSAKHKAEILNYHISADKLQILIKGNSDQVSDLVKQVAVRAASKHRRQTGKEAPFWRKRFNATLVQNGIHSLRCSISMDMTMVAEEKCFYPGEWDSSGYDEISGTRKRYRIISRNKAAEIFGFNDYLSMQKWYLLNCIPELETLDRHNLITALAIGDLKRIEKIAMHFPRRNVEIRKLIENSPEATYGLFISNVAKHKFTRSLKY